jgi:hypothetical protein
MEQGERPNRHSPAARQTSVTKQSHEKVWRLRKWQPKSGLHAKSHDAAAAATKGWRPKKRCTLPKTLGYQEANTGTQPRATVTSRHSK